MYGQFFVLFAIVFTGYFFRKCHLIDDAMNHGLNWFIVYFAYPCVIVHNIGTLDMAASMLRDFIITFILSIAAFALYSLYSLGYAKLRKFPKENSNVAEMAMVSPNNGFMGFPVSQIFFGQAGFLMMIAHNAAMNVYFFTYGLVLLRRNNDDRERLTAAAVVKAFIKVILNPNILALFIGFGIYLSGIEFEGTPVDTYLTYIGNVATPMAMIFIGSSLAEKNIREIIRDRVVIEGTINKLILVPVLTFACVYFLPVSALIRQIIVLGGCFPVAATVAMLAEQEHQDKNLASGILFLSTLFSMATIPLIIRLLTVLI